MWEFPLYLESALGIPSQYIMLMGEFPLYLESALGIPSQYIILTWEFPISILYRTFVNRLGYISGFVTPILEKTVLDDVRIDVFEDMW